MYIGKKDLAGAIECNYVIKNFSEALFLCFIRADESNLKKLEEVFPEQAKTFGAYKQYGLDLSEEEVLV